MKESKQNHLDEKQFHILMKLLDIAHSDDKEQLQGHQRVLAFYSGTILAVIGGILLINKDLEDTELGVLSFVIGGMLISLFSYIGYQGCYSYYRRQLESIALRAKIEDLLELGSVEKYGGRS